MPEIPAVENSDDMYLCTAVPLPDPEKTYYAVR
jgi:hypothetical protein